MRERGLCYGDAAQYDRLIAFQSALYASAKVNLGSSFPVAATSLTGRYGSYGIVAAKGGFDRATDFGNMHDDLGGRHPGSGGWGDDGYGSLARQLRDLELLAPGKVP